MWDRCFFGFFFFKQKTAYEIGTGDWSSDVCSSDLTRCRITASFVAEPIEQALGFIMHEALGIDVTVEFSDFNQVFQEALDRKSVV